MLPRDYATKKMTIQMRFEYLKLMQERYRHCGKAMRGELLDEMQQMTGLHRKTLIQRMASDMRRRPRRKQRGRRYGIEVDDALRVDRREPGLHRGRTSAAGLGTYGTSSADTVS